MAPVRLPRCELADWANPMANDKTTSYLTPEARAVKNARQVNLAASRSPRSPPACHVWTAVSEPGSGPS